MRIRIVLEVSQYDSVEVSILETVLKLYNEKSQLELGLEQIQEIVSRSNSRLDVKEIQVLEPGCVSF